LSLGRLDLLLKGGAVYDGTGGTPFEADIGISGDTITLVGGVPAGTADRVLDVSGFCVSPGFVDTHGHSDFSLLAAPSAEGKVLQGVTTEINGNCGVSAAPLSGDALAQREGDLGEYGIKERWRGLGQYMGILEARRPALNFATLAGHGNLRASVMGYSSRNPDAGETEAMKSLLRECLEAGALGLSTGLIYPPGVYSTPGELAELAASGSEAVGEGFIYATHMRSEGERLLESVEETLRIGEDTGVKVHISHIKTAGRENWHKAEACIRMLEEAAAGGVRVTCDRYPYTAGATGLDSVLPAWAFEGGNARELQRLEDPGQRERILAEMPQGDECWERVVVSEAGSKENKWMEGGSVLEIASSMGLSPRDAVLKILVEERLRVGAIFHSMSGENLKKFYSLPCCMVGSDSSARSFSGPTRKGKPHPRGFGSFPRFIRNFSGRAEEGRIPLAEAVRRITGLPARTFGVKRRGLIREGFYADIVVFHKDEIRDRATFGEPFLKPGGISHVIVNGRPVASHGELTGERPGRVLRGG
jgi:N-acyl-D-amino-acid deacylase